MKTIALFALLALVAGCSTVARFRPDDAAPRAAAKSAADVQVYSLRPPGKSVTVLGLVVASADAGDDATKSMNLLKAEAAALGADAIVDVRLEIAYGYWESGIRASGLAVQLK